MFRGESGTHSREHTQIALRELAASEEALQDKEYCDTRHIPAGAQHAPARGKPACLQTERLFEGVEDSRAAGMEHEMFELVEVEAQRITGLLQIVAELLAHDVRD